MRIQRTNMSSNGPSPLFPLTTHALIFLVYLILAVVAAGDWGARVHIVGGDFLSLFLPQRGRYELLIVLYLRLANDSRTLCFLNFAGFCWTFVFVGYLTKFQTNHTYQRQLLSW